MSTTLEAALAALEEGPNHAIYLVSGDLVVAEPAARRLAEALAARGRAQVETLRRPARLADALGDLRTYSLFAGCRVLLVVESALLADHRAAADLLDEIAADLPVAVEGELSRAERSAAGRLLQVLRLFELNPYGGAAADVVAAVPDWALSGGQARRRKRPQAEVSALREDLARLLDRARAAGLYGSAESDVAELAHILDNGLPPSHALVMAESAVSAEHPLVAALARRGALVELAHVEGGRRGDWQGIDALAAQLAAETGVGIDRQALDELAARTLRQESDRSPRVQSDSSARFAAEYRKLAALSGGGCIGAAMVREVVEDRGQEDAWKILDAIAEGRGGEALRRIDRLLAAAEDETAARLLLFGLLAGFCRQLTAVAGAMSVAGVAAGTRHFGIFKEALLPRLLDAVAGVESPLKGVHPFRLHRAYLAASRLPPELLRRLPWKVLETELRLKGESRDAAAALAALVSDLATAAG